MQLNQLKPGQAGVVSALSPEKYTRLGELGLLPGTAVTCLRRAPAGDPTAYQFKGVVVALRQDCAREIALEGGEGHGG